MTLAQVLQNWGVVPDRVRLLKGGDANVHWSVSADDQRYVLRRYGTHRDLPQVRWEHHLLAVLGARGWPVAVPVGEPITVDGRIYSLFPYIGGQSMRGSDDDRRRRCGRILAELHLDVWSLGIGARPAEPKIVEFAPDQILRHRDALRLALGSADAELFAEHARRVAGNFERLGVRDFPKSIAHRDMSPWNLRFRDGRLSALYDLDHADIDARAADVACGRRGYHDAFVEGYLDVFALSDEELEALGSLWSAHMLGYAARLIAEAMSSDSWNLPELRWCRTQLTKVVPFGQS